VIDSRFISALRILSDLRWLRAIRNSLVLLLPVTFVGAMAMLVGSFPLAALFPLSPAATEAWQAVRDMALLAADASGGIVAVCLTVLISHYLAVEARVRNLADVSPILVATIALVNFFLYVRLLVPDSSLLTLGARSVWPAILAALFSAEFFCRALRVKVLRFGKASYDLDPSLSQALLAIIPAMATVLFWLLFCRGFMLVAFDLGQSLHAILLALRRLFDSELPPLLMLGAMNQLLWFFGIHGANVLDGVLHASFSFVGDPNQVFAIPRIFIDLYAQIGGAGSTLGLLLAILIHVPQGEARQVAKYALLPSLFNINELLLFGLPIVFNPIYLIPFLFAPLAQMVLSYLCVHSGLVVVDVTPIPWMTPPILGGMLNSGGWHGGALQCVNFLLSVVIYSPFVRFAEREKRSDNLRKMQRQIGEIEALQLRHGSVLDRHDALGNTARKLLSDFLQDMGESRSENRAQSQAEHRGEGFSQARQAPRVFFAYQPQHDRAGRVVGVEALLRWRHRQVGFISPAVICALLEEANHITQVGRWAIRSACRQLRDWKQKGISGLRVSVNLSPLQLRDSSLLGFVAESLRANDLQAFELALELTESQRVPDDNLSVSTLKGLEALGVHLEMDDFGMGYSSMLYLRRFQFNAIKLDRLLTGDVLQDNNCCDIIGSVVQLALALRLRVIAEFVETREQQALLEKLGCDSFQGYLYSPALPGEQCLAYLREHAAAPLSAAAESAVSDDPDALSLPSLASDAA